MQVDQVLEELGRIEENARNEAEREFLAEIRQLAERSKRDVHLYLKFIGD